MSTRAKFKLTASQVKRGTFEPGKRCADGANLYLAVSIGGTKSWVVRIKVDGKEKILAAAASKRCHWPMLASGRKTIREQVAKGENPLNVAKTTFEETCRALIRIKAKDWKHRFVKQRWEQILDQYCGSLANVQVAKIEPMHVAEALTPLWHSCSAIPPITLVIAVLLMPEISLEG